MGCEVPSLLGLRITGRTYVTKANSTPKSHFEHCGNSFICNVSSSFGTHIRHFSTLAAAPFPRPNWEFLSTSCHVFRKNLLGRTFSEPVAVILFGEQLSKRTSTMTV